jgi:hypothetical protein
MGQVGQPQDVKRRAKKNRQPSSENQVNPTRGVERVVDRLVQQRPERVIQACNGNNKDTPPQAFRQEIKRQNKKLEQVQENV